MFCGKCGAAVPNGAAFCTSCGAPVSAPAAQPVAPAPVQPVEPVVAQPVAPAPVQPVEPVVAQPTFVQPDFVQPAAFSDPFVPAAPAAPKKKGKGLGVALIALVAAAAVFVSCVAGPLWFGWFPNSKLTKQITKWFGSEDAYMSAVEADTVETLADAISTGYGNMVNSYKGLLVGDKYTSTTISLEVGDAVRDMLIAAIPESAGVDVEQLFSLLDGTSLTFAGGKVEDIYQIAMGLGLGGQDILDVTMILDMINEEAYVAIPTLTDLYLDVSQIFDEIELDADSLAAMEQVADVMEALPSEEVINNLLSKYLKLALDQFDDVTKDSDTIKVGGIEEKVTVLETKITEKALAKAAEAVLDAVKDDKDIKQILVKVGNAVGELQGQEDLGDQLYEQFSEVVEDALAELDDMDYGESSGAYVLLTDYINGSHEIIGRKVTTRFDDEKQDILYYATTKDGKDFAFTLEVEGVEVVSGKGTDDKDILNGTFDIIVDDQEMVTIQVSDLNTNGLEQGNLKGSFIVTLNEDIMEQAIDELDLPADVASSLSLLDCSLRIDVDSSATAGYIRVALCNGSKTLLGIKLESTITDEKVSVPKPDQIADMDNITDWLESIDIKDLVNNLRKAGFPSELLDMLEEGFESGFGTSVTPTPDIDVGYVDDWYEEPSFEEDWYDEPSKEEEWYDEPVAGEDWYEEPSKEEEWYDDGSYIEDDWYAGSL